MPGKVLAVAEGPADAEWWGAVWVPVQEGSQSLTALVPTHPIGKADVEELMM